ncbi:addiction module toxin RelE [Nostoc sp. CENA543]|uniref:type II toxin-antitoxin system RelE/ParE family toxin n=1 Tax=Nostoc sp. CENA543 TaxID=1869241 RepID=UPI000CA32307|nr:type II toxin-antitoxin system RelE/ParE family toxin [Nostoc sp. CENA543]AUS99843.1 addiction module toxin RelE [Nostoc sp. CENA543]
MTYNLIIQPEAEYDIQDVFEWYESQNLGLGSEFVRAVDVCLSGIGRNPLAYQVIYKQVRRALIRRFPYIILYVFDQDTVSVIACFHAKRDPKQWLERI